MNDGTIPPVPNDLTPSSLLNWLLGMLIGIVAFLWKLNEGKNGKAIADLDARLIVSDRKHDECDQDRNTLREKFGRLEERFNLLEKQSVHKSD